MNTISKFQLFLLRWIFRKAVIQGYNHPNNIVEIYYELHKCIQEEFTEDNKATSYANCKEWFDDSWNVV